MFGRARDEAELRVDDILGDEQAADEAARLDALRDRVEQVESQLASQFTSLAAYAQIAQEQVELVRSESKAAVERTEERVVSLIERERTDRIATVTGDVPAGSAPDVMMRVESMERTMAKIAQGLDDCLDRQLQLADAITRVFERRDDVTSEEQPAIELAPAAPVVEPEVPELTLTLPPLPSIADMEPPVDDRPATAGDGPIPALALD